MSNPGACSGRENSRPNPRRFSPRNKTTLPRGYQGEVAKEAFVTGQRYKHEVSDDLFSREPGDWVQESKREVSPEPLPKGTSGTHTITETVPDSGDKPKKKKHHHLFRREASLEPLPVSPRSTTSPWGMVRPSPTENPRLRTRHVGLRMGP